MMNAKHLTRDPAGLEVGGSGRAARPSTPGAYPKKVVLALSAAGLCALSACQTPQTTLAEPLPAEVARRLETVREERTEFPTFGAIPAPPANLRTPAQWAQIVGQLETRGAVVGSWPQRNPAWITDPEGDARRLQAQTYVAPADMPRPDQIQRTEAFAETLRKRTVPPARID
jgi:hypothetical protein